MATKDTDYTSSISNKEKTLLSVFKKTMNESKSNAVYNDLIQNQIVDGTSTSKNGVSASKLLTSTALNELLNEEKIKSLLDKMHTRNLDTKLEGLETLILKCNSSSAVKLVSFMYKDKEVAYIDINGNYHGGFGNFTEDEIINLLENCMASEDLVNILSGYVRISEVFDTVNNTKTIKKELIPEELFTNSNKTLVNTIEEVADDVVDTHESLNWGSF